MPTRFALAVLSLAIALPARPAQSDEPRFLIDSIVTQGVRGESSRIVTAESRLRVATAYTEGELREAVFRLNRLPFVVRADFRLQKAAVRDHYVLIISIVATKALFASFRTVRWPPDAGGVLAFFDDPENDVRYSVFSPGESSRWVQQSTLGARWLIGSRTLAYAAAERSNGDRYSIGLTQYDVFHRGIAVSARLSYREGSFRLPAFLDAAGRDAMSFGDHLAENVTLAVPVARNSAVRLSWSRDTTPYAYNATDPLFDSNGRIHAIRLHDDRGELAFLTDTTNDPLLPASGFRARAAFTTGHELRLVPGPTHLTFDVDYPRTRDLEANLARYWAVGETRSVWIAGNGVTRDDRIVRQYDVRLGASAALRTPASGDGDLRFEAEVQHLDAHHMPVRQHNIGRAGLVFRNAWGVVRLDAYIGWGRRR